MRPATTPLRRSYVSPALIVRDSRFSWGSQTFVMGVINVTPDSFSGDGVAGQRGVAAAMARQFEADGAHLLDIGAESSRPGAAGVTADEELRRLLPALEEVRAATRLPVSVDTVHASVAAAALDAGADIVNDISGLGADLAMAALVADRGVPLVLMHNQRGRPSSGDTVADIRSGLDEALGRADRAGIPRANLILDPGFGFGWRPEQNLEMVRRLPDLWDLRLPILLGPSRKSTLGLVLDAPADDRLEGTAAAVALGIAGGADIVRVHDVREMARVARVTDAIARANWQAP